MKLLDALTILVCLITLSLMAVDWIIPYLVGLGSALILIIIRGILSIRTMYKEHKARKRRVAIYFSKIKMNR